MQISPRGIYLCPCTCRRAVHLWTGYYLVLSGIAQGPVQMSNNSYLDRPKLYTVGLIVGSDQTNSQWSQPFWLLIGTRKLLCFSAQSEAKMAATVWNWSGKTLSPGALLDVLHFSSCHIFPPVQTFRRPHYLPLGLRGWVQPGYLTNNTNGTFAALPHALFDPLSRL